MNNLGPAMKYYLLQRNISIKQVADETHISKSSLYDFFNGKHELGATNFVYLIQHLNIDFNNVIDEYHDAVDNSDRNIDTEYETIKQLETKDLTKYLSGFGIHQTAIVLADFIVQAQYEGELSEKINVIQDVARDLVFDKLDYYTVDELNLFINLISISSNFNYIYGVYLDCERLFSRQDFNAMHRNQSESIQQLLMIRFNMIVLCMKHQSKNLAKKIIYLAQQLREVIDDMYSVLLLRLMDVIKLIISKKEERAKILYDNIFSAMSYFLPATGQFRFEMLFLKSFEQFKQTLE
ncbi:MAG: helix-turn-helix transcriptional regulator [Leuconostoc gelidum]|jgi:transcriptional regulator with XRE-family HTH domain|uniref:helix-turn-helix domain-containing protein n=1 Tax=Leuconostoc gelidum TaxID=1244 RepID=UPI002F35AC23